jgi:hypothetical protein
MVPAMFQLHMPVLTGPRSPGMITRCFRNQLLTGQL